MNISLKQIREQLQYELNRFIWEAKKYNNAQGTNMYSINNLNTIRSVISNIGKMGLFEKYIDILKELAIFTTIEDQMALQYSEGYKIVEHLDTLKTLCSNFLETLIKIIPPEDANSINIKLPPISDFDELSKVTRNIHLGLTQVVYLEDLQGQTKIVSVENGSIWFNVFVGSTEALYVIASLVWASAVIYKKIQEGKSHAEYAKRIKIKNEYLKELQNAQKTELDLMIKAEAEYIQSSHFKMNAPESFERIKNSISIFAELIEKGAEIHPSLVVPENVSNLFPNPASLINLESKIKKIESSNNKNTTNN